MIPISAGEYTRYAAVRAVSPSAIGVELALKTSDKFQEHDRLWTDTFWLEIS